jgi:large subunit ribosomal protein L3
MKSKHSKKQTFAIIGKKLGMTQIYNANKVLIPVTVVEAGPCPVTQIKKTDKEGYNAIQIGFGEQKPQRMTQGMLGHLKKAGVEGIKVLNEIRTESLSEYELGQVLKADMFTEGQYVDISGVTIGRGFQGVIKRWGFAGGPASHGSMFHRRGGSYGMRQTPGHVYKQRKMPGRMGGKNRTIQNLEVIKVIPEQNLILIKGSFPGSEGSIVTIRNSKKKGKFA